MLKYVAVLLLFGGASSSEALPKQVQKPTAPAVFKKPNQTTMRPVNIPVTANQSFNATLIVPATTNKSPAIIFIPGFVPGSRNDSEESWRGPNLEDSGTALTRYLNDLGFAVLHVPIGFGHGSGKAPNSLDELADRTVAAAEFLKRQPEIQGEHIGIIGQSVGGFIAVKAAARSKNLTFLVTLATPMESIDRTFDEVLDKLLQQGGAPESDRLTIRSKMKNLCEIAAKGASAQTLRPGVEDFLRSEFTWLPKQQRDYIGKTPEEFVARLADDHVNDLATPLYQSMIGYDVGQSMPHIRCRALLLFAEHDFKVEPTRSSKIATDLIHKAGRRDASVTVIPGANHFFEMENPSSDTTPAKIDQRFPKIFLETLKTFLLKNARASE